MVHAACGANATVTWARRSGALQSHPLGLCAHELHSLIAGQRLRPRVTIQLVRLLRLQRPSGCRQQTNGS